jgi:hypothetical protein
MLHKPSRRFAFVAVPELFESVIKRTGTASNEHDARQIISAKWSSYIAMKLETDLNFFTAQCVRAMSRPVSTS